MQAAFQMEMKLATLLWQSVGSLRRLWMMQPWLTFPKMSGVSSTSKQRS